MTTKETISRLEAEVKELSDALTVIMHELADGNRNRYSCDSYLPDPFKALGFAVLAKRGVRFDQDGTTHFERVAA